MKKYFLNTALVTFVALLVLAVGSADAQIIGTYVDAAEGAGGNTVRESDGDDIAWQLIGSSDTDNLWNNRLDFGEDGPDVFESNGPSEDAPLIKTTIAGLANGLYGIRVIYWSQALTDPGNDWPIQAGLSAGSLTTYNEAGGIATGTTDAGGALVEYQALVGTASAVGGEIDAFIDDVAGGDARTWYDGVSYEFLPFALGDFSGTDGVGLEDFDIMKTNWLSTGNALNTNGEVTGDGLVDLADFKIFKEDLFPGGAAGFAAAMAVPEPSTLVLLLAAVPACFLLRSRSRKIRSAEFSG